MRLEGSDGLRWKGYTLPFTGEIWTNKQNLIYEDVQSNNYEIFQCNL